MKSGSLMDFLVTHYRAIMIGIGVVIGVCVVAVIGLFVSRIRPVGTYLEIAVAPTEAKVMIGGQEYRNGVYEVEPGRYTAEISREGFASKTAEVMVEKKKTAKLATFLLNEKEGMEYFERSEADIRALRMSDDPEAKEFLEKYDRKMKIRKELPINATYNLPGPDGKNNFQVQKVEDGSDDEWCEKILCLKVVAQKLNEEAVREKLNELGYNLSDYEVVYVEE